MNSRDGQDMLVVLFFIPLGVESQINDHLADVLRTSGEYRLACQL